MTITTNDTELSQALIDSLIGETWVDDLVGPNNGKTWEVLSFNPAGVGYFSCRIKGSRGGAGTIQSLTLMQLLKALGRTDAPGAAQADTTEAAAPPAVDGSDLIGKSWKDADGVRLTAERIDEKGSVVAVDLDGYEQYYTVDEVRDLLWEEAGEAAPEPTQESTADVVDNETVLDQVEEAATVTVDPELAAAGYADDQKYRNEQLEDNKRKEYDVPSAVVAEFTKLIRDLIAAINEDGGKGHVTLKAKAKAGEDSREIFLEYEVGMTPPKRKADGYFWSGDDLVPGVKKRAEDKQTTIVDAIKQAGPIAPKPAEPAADTPAPAAEPAPLTLTVENARAVLTYPGDHAEPFRAAAVAMAKADPALLEGLDVDPMMLDRINADTDPGEQAGDYYSADAAAEPPGETTAERIAADEASDDEIPPYGGSEDDVDDEGDGYSEPTLP